MTALGFLHTAAAHVATFEALTTRAGASALHAVHPDLLARARASGGGDSDLARDVGAAINALFTAGADIVVCTCSTLGPLAEALGPRVARIDRPMAARAVMLGPRVMVVATTPSTIGPTLDLIAEEASRQDLPVSVTPLVVPEAWPAFEAGDMTAYHDAIVGAILAAAPADVLVLAQASMADAAQDPRLAGRRVLTSPESGIAAALALARA